MNNDYLFSEGCWSRTEVPWDEGLQRPVGFEIASIEIGDEYGVHLTVWDRAEGSEAEWEFVVGLWDSNRAWMVACPTLPDMIAIVNQYIPIVNGVQETEDRVERREHYSRGHRSTADCRYCRMVEERQD